MSLLLLYVLMYSSMRADFYSTSVSEHSMIIVFVYVCYIRRKIERCSVRTYVQSCSLIPQYKEVPSLAEGLLY